MQRNLHPQSSFSLRIAICEQVFPVFLVRKVLQGALVVCRPIFDALRRISFRSGRLRLPLHVLAASGLCFAPFSGSGGLPLTAF